MTYAHDDFFVFLAAAKHVLFWFRDGQQVSDDEVKDLLGIAFRHKDDGDKVTQKMFILAIAIDEHHRGVFDVPRNQIDRLADQLNELVYLAGQDSH
jgi:hypothetical protein